VENLTINDVHGLTEMTVDLVKKVGNKFVRVNNSAAKNVVDLQIGGREVKLEGDKLLEEPILKELQKTGYAILSEETGYIPGKFLPGLLWVVDPLDGSYNFSRSLGPSMISVALWNDNEPVLGVLYNLSTKQIIFGGPRIGSHIGSTVMKVSDRRHQSSERVCNNSDDIWQNSNDRFCRRIAITSCNRSCRRLRRT
jgi:fructose-1,6-bisphosphatase/inositol monophosphatase family enzyme